MIYKMKRTPKAKHGYKVWFRKESLKDTVRILNHMLNCDCEVTYVVDVQFNKPSVLVYTNSDEHAEWFDGMIKQGENNA